uniref:G_PROTEIN_RECEP_F1_2 domain-containing protein n=1 Tax=Elaeophora elaphi TaxID=1147741 RepID=A0A0R3RRU8_9BILA
MMWFTVGEAIIGIHPLSNALINLILLRPYRRALRKMWCEKKELKTVQYDSITIADTHFMDGDCLL